MQDRLRSEPDDGQAGSGPFYFAAAVLAAVAFIGILVPLARPELLGEPPLPLVSFLMGTLLMPLAGWFLVWPAVLRQQSKALLDFPVALKEVQGRLADLEAVRREHYKGRTAVEGAVQTLNENATLFARLLQGMQQMLLDRKKIDDELDGLRLDLAQKGKEVDRWRDACIAYVRALERALDPASGLAPEFQAAGEKLAKDFLRSVAPLGLEVIRPETGDLFDDRVHRADGQQPTDQAAPGRVFRCSAWGFRLGGAVLEHARVVLAAPAPTGPPAQGPARSAPSTVSS